MLTAWITIVVVFLLSFFATRKMKLVPSGLQNVMEAVVEALANFVDGVVGEEKGRKFFPVIATIFIFVFVNAWLALLPGFMTFGFLEEVHGETVIVPILRGANSDVNVPLAIALVSFCFVEYWGLRSNGFKYLTKFFNLRKLFSGLGMIMRGKVKSGIGTALSGLIDAFAGVVETLSEFIRIISFTFRLFGNMTAGEILLFSMMFLIPWLVPLPFYGLELFVGFVQALIFSGLTLVFLAIAVTPHEEH